MNTWSQPVSGSFAYPSTVGTMAPSAQREMEQAIAALCAQQDEWIRKPIGYRIKLLDELIGDVARVAPRWVEAGLDAMSIRASPTGIGTEWFVGPYVVLRNLRGLKKSLQDITTLGHPRIPGRVSTRPDGRVVANVFPSDEYDRVLYLGYKADVWMPRGVSAEELAQTQAQAYRRTKEFGQIALVLGAGNASGIPATDALYKLFVENEVVLLKLNPVNDYIGPILAEGFRALIREGFLRLVYGGANEGAWLCAHPAIHEIHVTGSDKTFDAILFGAGAEQAQRKREHQPRLTKRVTGELGNVTPLIIVPGPWTTSDLEYQAENVASWLYENAGCSCNSPRVIVQHAEWSLRDAFLDALRAQFRKLPPRRAFYPGACERYEQFLRAHPDAERFGKPSAGELPWTLAAGIAPENTDDICFRSEAFCPFLAETRIPAADVPTFMERAVEFANETLWGTLSAALLVHPASRKDSNIAPALERAMDDLEYGTVGINIRAGVGWIITETPWGAFPNSDIYDVQSGIGVVHNTLMFAETYRSVIAMPFRARPKPIMFYSRGDALQQLGPLVTDLQAQPDPRKVPRILWTAIR